MHQHLLKVRDVLFSNLPTLASTACTYDPTSVAIAPGMSLFSKVRGEQPAASESAVAPVESAEEEKREYTIWSTSPMLALPDDLLTNCSFSKR